MMHLLDDEQSNINLKSQVEILQKPIWILGITLITSGSIFLIITLSVLLIQSLDLSNLIVSIPFFCISIMFVVAGQYMYKHNGEAEKNLTGIHLYYLAWMIFMVTIFIVTIIINIGDFLRFLI